MKERIKKLKQPRHEEQDVIHNVNVVAIIITNTPT